MVVLKFDKKNKVWLELLENLKDSECISLNLKLKHKLDNIKMILKKDWDCFFLIDGLEGAGKSTLGQICAYYLSDTIFTSENICKSAREAIEKISSFPSESVLIVDEGDLAFSSKDIFNQEQKLLINLTKVIRFRRLILIIIAPTFFDLNKGISVRRSKFLLHVYTDKQLNRGRFAYFGPRKKQVLYELGKKNYGSYAKPSADFIGTFSNIHILPDYKETKDETVDLMIKQNAEGGRFKVQRDFLLEHIKQQEHLTYEEMQELMKKCQFPLKKDEISKVIRKKA